MKKSVGDLHKADLEGELTGQVAEGGFLSRSVDWIIGERSLARGR